MAGTASRHGFDLLVGIGDGPGRWVEHLSREGGQNCLSFETIDEATAKLSSHLVDGDHLLLKASRGARLERLAEFLLSNAQDSVETNESRIQQNKSTSGASGQALCQVLAGSVSTGLGGMMS